MSSGPAVLVMAKAPRPGLVKTRLGALLGDDGCAKLQALLVRRAAGLAFAVAPGSTYVAFHPADGGAEMAELVPDGAVLMAQRGGHLGERLAAATADVFAARRAPLVAIGTDIPLLEPAHLREALGSLETGNDVVFGPANDGGYYLVGLRRPLPVLFDIAPRLWGGPEVLAASLARAEAAHLCVGQLEVLTDLDTAEDAMALLGEPGLPRDLRDVLASGLAPIRLGGEA